MAQTGEVFRKSGVSAAEGITLSGARSRVETENRSSLWRRLLS